MVSGFISDRIGWQKVLVFSFFGMALSMIWLLFLEATWMLYCFVLFYGIFQGARAPAQVGILGEFFGMRSLGELIGITSAASMLLAALAPSMAGFVFDTTGSYSVAFIIVMAFLFTAGLVATMMREPPITSK
jgi:MFS family permease